VDDRTALLLAWLEGEGERQRRPFFPPPQAKDPALRGWVQVGVSALGATLAAALFVCWLATAWEQAIRVAAREEVRLEWINRATGEPNRVALPMAWLKGEREWRGHLSPPQVEDHSVRRWFFGVGLLAGILAASLLVYWLTAAWAVRSGCRHEKGWVDEGQRGGGKMKGIQRRTRRHSKPATR
jgi:hypothetical protein